MGQQQLLLIVLGVIIVGIAIVVGINLFNANAVSANRDAVVSDLNNLAAMAQQYYKKPTSMGGGGNSFTGWTIPSGLTSNANGTYAIKTAGTSTSVQIEGVGTEKVGTDTVTADITVYSDSVHTAIVH
jgi:Tfp pilus assembly protein PilE